MTDSRWIDPEVDNILDGDAELTQLAHLVRASRPEARLDERFQGVLRAQLMREAPATLGSPVKQAKQRTAKDRSFRTRRAPWWRRPMPFAFGAAGLGAALVAAAVLTAIRTPLQDHQVTAISAVAELHAVSPDNVITVAFNEPMDHAAVVAGLHIRPATQVTTAWQGNNLLITPTHHLAGNTPYTVTIDHAAARAASGALAAADIRISFGTAPTPPPAPSITPLAPVTLASVSDSAQLISVADGSVIATASSATGTPITLQPSATSPSATTSASASASPSQSASASASASPTLAGEMVSMSPGGVVTDLGPAASAAALAPNGLRLVAAVPTSVGTTVELVPVDGSQRRVLARLATAVLATGWQSSDTALVAEPDRIVTVDLQGRVGTLMTLPAGTTQVIFSPTGGQVFVGGGGSDGQLIDLATQQTQTLPGSRLMAAFSGDGSTVAWVDATATPTQLITTPVAHQATAAIPLNRPGDTIGAIGLDQTGSHVAVVDEHAAGGGELDVLALPSGAVIASGPESRAPAYSPQGDHLAFVSGGSAQIAPVPGVAAGTAVNLLPDGAASALKAFVDAQVAGDTAALQNLSAPGVDATGATPPGLSRAYVISAVTNPDMTVTATARLIVDPSRGHAAASFADESLGLSPKVGGGYQVTSLSTGPLHDEPIGPHVVSVVPVAGDTLVLRVSFDSDLRGDSVAGAITVSTRKTGPLLTTIVYDPNTRTATITVPVGPDTAVTLMIDTSLVDVDGQALATPFRAVSGG
jgi:hypothetical protein